MLPHDLHLPFHCTPDILAIDFTSIWENGMKIEEKRSRLLLIDDDAEYCQLVRDYMELQNLSLEYCNTGGEGISAVQRGFDLVLLDMMLPDIPGVEVLRRIRESCGIPVIILSAHNDETDRIVTLELGADDYVPKSFSSRELLARVRAVLRRAFQNKPVSNEDDIIILHGIKINPRMMRVSCGEKEVEFTFVEFQILHAMMREPGRIFSREALLNLFSDKEWSKFDRSVDVHISSLRKKLSDITSGQSPIRTVRGIGYTFTRQDEQ